MHNPDYKQTAAVKEMNLTNGIKETANLLLFYMSKNKKHQRDSIAFIKISKKETTIVFKKMGRHQRRLITILYEKFPVGHPSRP